MNEEHGNDVDSVNYIAYLYLITESNVLWIAKQLQPIEEWLHQLLRFNLPL